LIFISLEDFMAELYPFAQQLELKVQEGKRTIDDQIPFEIVIGLPESHFVV